MTTTPDYGVKWDDVIQCLQDAYAYQLAHGVCQKSYLEPDGRVCLAGALRWGAGWGHYQQTPTSIQQYIDQNTELGITLSEEWKRQVHKQLHYAVTDEYARLVYQEALAFLALRLEGSDQDSVFAFNDQNEPGTVLEFLHSAVIAAKEVSE